MLTIARLFRVLQVLSLSALLFASPAWAQQSYRDTNDDTATLSQGVENEADDDGRTFEQELADIKRQYADLVPDHQKSAASRETLSDIGTDEEDEDEEEE